MATPSVNRTGFGWEFLDNDIIAQARQKLPRTRIDEVAKLGSLTKKEVAYVLGVTERNLYNHTEGSLSVPLSERLLLLQRLFEHGLTVFDGHVDLLSNWLRTPLAELAVTTANRSEAHSETPPTTYTPQSMAELGTKEGPTDLAGAAKRRRERLAHRAQEPSVPYPTPFSLLDTITGCRLVDNVFTRIEAGVFS